jgi:hypothetical protein
LGVSQSAQVKWLGPLACWADNRITSHKDYGKLDLPPVLDFGANEDPTKSQKSLIDAPPVPTASHDIPDTVGSISPISTSINPRAFSLKYSLHWLFFASLNMVKLDGSKFLFYHLIVFFFPSSK